ncbi:methyltransferase domain-containing protein [Reichenbachiella carrageenanivorans]|uniref:Methyltransferase domain-containing protein n=1 Tax=Reichenbachiella carrageenanivorans TaxID=2979869 RepID=A0ABY6CWR5_9BACT|nr:class I SAM-dependent methyltransferase [Reichenbachiella carrageenanivorans]UXX78352.1 methyltransferase domain-containing protein [Reichenbachiella carrageenanivorans]
MSDKEFWEDFYSNKKGTLEPSSFATYVFEEIKLSGNLVELGCGNGRDSIFFAEQGLEVFGMDQCQSTVSRLSELNKENTRFEVQDFTALGDLGKFDNVYSRFTLHSVSKEQASRTLNWAYGALNDGGKLCIEVRSVNDELCGQGTEVGKDAYVTDHYRRFVRMDEMLEELRGIGFQITYSIESKGLAVYKEEDPSIIRIVATK